MGDRRGRAQRRRRGAAQSRGGAASRTTHRQSRGRAGGAVRPRARPAAARPGGRSDRVDRARPLATSRRCGARCGAASCRPPTSRACAAISISRSICCSRRVTSLPPSRLAERSRARTLLDGLAESAAKIRKGVDPALLVRQRAVQTQLNAKESYRAQVALQEGDTSARAAAIGRDIVRLLEELNRAAGDHPQREPCLRALQSPRADHARSRAAHAPRRGHRPRRVPPRRGAQLRLGCRSRVRHGARAAAGEGHRRPGRRYHELLSREVESLQRRRARAAGAAAPHARPTSGHDGLDADPVARSRRQAPPRRGRLGPPIRAVLGASRRVRRTADRPHTKSRTCHRLRCSTSIRRESRPISANAPTAVFADPVFSKNDPRFGAERDAATPALTRASDGGDVRQAPVLAPRSGGHRRGFTRRRSRRWTFRCQEHARGARPAQYRILHFATHGSSTLSIPSCPASSSRSSIATASRPMASCACTKSTTSISTPTSSSSAPAARRSAAKCTAKASLA